MIPPAISGSQLHELHNVRVVTAEHLLAEGHAGEEIDGLICGAAPDREEQRVHGTMGKAVGECQGLPVKGCQPGALPFLSNGLKPND